MGMLDLGVSQYLMPAFVGGVFFPVHIGCTYCLELIGEPNTGDIALRMERVTMTGRDFLAAFRDFRDNFVPELWNAFGSGTPPKIFAITKLLC
jgi:hypothetical protein